MIHKIGVETTVLDLFFAEIPGKLMYNGTYHLHMGQFICTQMMFII